MSGLISCWFVQCCTNVETITPTSILNLPRTKSDMVSIYCQCVTLRPVPCMFHACVMMSVLFNTCCNDEAVTGSVHGNDCHSSCTVSQEYDTSTVVSACTYT